MSISINSSSAHLAASISSASQTQQQPKPKAPPAVSQAASVENTHQPVSKPVGNIGNNINVKA